MELETGVSAISQVASASGLEGHALSWPIYNMASGADYQNASRAW